MGGMQCASLILSVIVRHWCNPPLSVLGTVP